MYFHVKIYFLRDCRRLSVHFLEIFDFELRDGPITEAALLNGLGQGQVDAGQEFGLPVVDHGVDAELDVQKGALSGQLLPDEAQGDDAIHVLGLEAQGVALLVGPLRLDDASQLLIFARRQKAHQLLKVVISDVVGDGTHGLLGARRHLVFVESGIDLMPDGVALEAVGQRVDGIGHHAEDAAPERLGRHRPIQHRRGKQSDAGGTGSGQRKARLAGGGGLDVFLVVPLDAPVLLDLAQDVVRKRLDLVQPRAVRRKAKLFLGQVQGHVQRVTAVVLHLRHRLRLGHLVSNQRRRISQQLDRLQDLVFSVSASLQKDGVGVKRVYADSLQLGQLFAHRVQRVVVQTEVGLEILQNVSFII